MLIAKKTLRLNLCLLYAWAKLNLEYDFKNSYSRILCYLNAVFSFSFYFSMKSSSIMENLRTILLIMQFLVKIEDRLDFVSD